MPVDHAAGFKLAQSCGQDFCGDLRDIFAQFAEAPGSAAQIPDDIRRPGPAEGLSDKSEVVSKITVEIAPRRRLAAIQPRPMHDLP